MEGGGQSGGGGGGGGGPAPFLLKTYEMVDDSSTDAIVSWSSNKSSFIVWNHPEFSRLLLPTYFKHNNFSSFIRQLNTYGFRKIDPEKWEFANEDFVKDKKHLLKNIYRRKPIHSHSIPPAGSVLDPERATFEEEIERLSREKADLQAKLWRFRQSETGTKAQLDELERRLQSMEQRQLKMMAFLAKAVQNPTFVEHLVRMAGTNPIDFSAFNKKRRQLPRDGEADGSFEHVDNRANDDLSCTSKPPEFGHMFPIDFSSKLKLELSPAVSDGNLVLVNTHSSNDDAGSPHRGQLTGPQMRPECLPFVPQVAELMDTGASLCPRKNTSSPWQAGIADEVDANISCHLNLTLASSPLQFNESHGSDKAANSISHHIDSATELMSGNASKEHDVHELAKKDRTNGDDRNVKVASLQEPVTTGNQGPVAPTGGVNDVFWEQFLTERPGSSDKEEASSGLRPNPQEEQKEERKAASEKLWRSRSDLDKLTL